MIIVWIAALFTEEHRATLDWLNRITDESFRFFALEVELWRIGESPAAPKFNVVSKPNNWSRSVARAARSIDDSVLSETQLMQRSYWDALNAALNQAAGPVSGNRKPRPQPWIVYPIGRTGFHLAAGMTVAKRQIRAELYISGDAAKANFHLLREQAAEIEQGLGHSLEWEELPTKRDSRVAVYLNDLEPADQTDWPRQHGWLATKLNGMHRVLSQRVRALDANERQPDSDPRRAAASAQSANSSDR